VYHDYEANLLLRNDEIVLLCNAFVGARWQGQGTGANISLTSEGGAGTIFTTGRPTPLPFASLV
jgi:hypothetical protein